MLCYVFILVIFRAFVLQHKIPTVVLFLYILYHTYSKHHKPLYAYTAHCNQVVL